MRSEREALRALSFLTGRLFSLCTVRIHIRRAGAVGSVAMYPWGGRKMLEVHYVLITFCVSRVQHDAFEYRVPVACVGCGCANAR